MSQNAANVEDLVKAHFSVKDHFDLPEGESEYVVVYGQDSKSKFVTLQSKLRDLGMVTSLSGSEEECVLTVRSSPSESAKRSKLPLVFGLLSLISILIFALGLRSGYAQYAPSLSGSFIMAGYIGSVLAIVAASELARRFISRGGRSGSAPGVYYVPGLPSLTSFLPVLGPLSFQRSPAVNRDSVFLLTIVPPVAILLASAVLFLVGGATASPSLPLAQGPQPCSSVNQTSLSLCWVSPSLVQLALGYVQGPFLPSVAQGSVLVSPFNDASTAGFLLAFIGLLPVVPFGGGLAANAAWGRGAARLLSYLGALGMIALDSPNYWALGVIVLIFAGRAPELRLQDSVSPLSSRNKTMVAVAALVAIACLPIPQNLFGVSLG